MIAKLSNLNELTNILTKKEKTYEVVLDFAKQFKIGQILKSFSSVKKQGFSVTSIIIALIFMRLGGLSISVSQKLDNFKMDDNTFYRLMNNPLINWKSILLSFSKRYLKSILEKGCSDKNSTKCFIIDDTDIEKTGKTFEGISKIFSHKEHSFLFGFKLLLICYWDGKTLIPCGLSLHRENKKNNYGLNKKQEKQQFKKGRSKEKYSKDYESELDENKIQVAIKTIKKIVSNGIIGSYVLMDSWFLCEEMLVEIRKIKKGILNIVGMCKTNRTFEIDGKTHNFKTITDIYTTQKKNQVHTCRKYKSQYFTVKCKYKGMDVKLFCIKYKRAKDWTILLTTDLSLSFVKAMEIYQIRWSIEVLFKECKQYLQLGKSQNTDLCGQVADAHLAMITYTILALYKRFEAYETLGEIFRNTKAEIIEKTICERIELVVLELINKLLELFCIDIEAAIYSLTSSTEAENEIIVLLNAVNQINTNKVA